MIQEEQNKETARGEEKDVDLLQMVSILWAHRRKVFKWCGIGAVIGLIIAFSIPKEYSVSVKLAPEITDPRAANGGLGALASMAGISTGYTGVTDAVYPLLYPDVVSSVPFMTGLFDVPVTTKEGETMTVQEFMEDHTSSPWWGVILGFPAKVIGMLIPDDEDEEENVSSSHKLDNFALTRKETDLLKALSNRVTANVDNKTMVVTIDVKMQDPRVSAILADTVAARLIEYITEYRTNKARQDLKYAQKLNDEAKVTYHEAQQKYADYVDKNQNIAFRSATLTRERLENEAALAFSLYNHTSQQVQKAKAKVQETTPVCAIFEPATVPIKPSSPRKVLILIGYTFLAFICCAVSILYIAPMRQARKEKKLAEEEKASDNKSK